MSIQLDDLDHEQVVEQTLKQILLELKKIRVHMEQITEDKISEFDIEDRQ